MCDPITVESKIYTDSSSSSSSQRRNLANTRQFRELTVFSRVLGKIEFDDLRVRSKNASELKVVIILLEL